MLLATPTLSDAATLTGGATASDMGLGNLQKRQPTTITRWTDLDNAYVEIDLGEDQPIDFAGLLYSNASVDAAWRLRAAASQADLTANPAYDSGAMTFHANKDGITLIWGTAADDPARTAYARAHALHAWAGAQHRWWRADVYDSENTDGYIDVGRLYLDNSFRPERTIRYGFNVGWLDGQVRGTSLDNNVFPQQRGTYRMWRGSLRWASEADMYDELFRIQRKRGTARDVLVLADKDNRDRLMDWTVYGLLTDIEPVVYQTYGLYEANITVREMP